MFKGSEHMFKDGELVFIVREQKIYNVVRKNLPSQNYFSQAFEEKKLRHKKSPPGESQGEKFIRVYKVLYFT